MTVQVRVTSAETLPAASVACTLKVCAATGSELNAMPLVQVLQAPASRRHWNVAVSSAENWKLAVVVVEELPAAVPPVIVTIGARVSRAGGGVDCGGGVVVDPPFPPSSTPSVPFSTSSPARTSQYHLPQQGAEPM